MTPALMVIAVPVCAAFVASAVSFAREMNAWSLMQLVGAGLLMVVVFSHVAEALDLFSAMGWGLPNSAGHYLDLVSAVAGLILFLAGYLSRRFAKRGIST